MPLELAVATTTLTLAAPSTTLVLRPFTGGAVTAGGEPVYSPDVRLLDSTGAVIADELGLALIDGPLILSDTGVVPSSAAGVTLALTNREP